MEKARRIHPDGIVDKGLSDHESLEPVPVELTGTCHYLQCARIMAVFAKFMGDDVNEQRFRDLSGKLEDIVRDEFWNKSHPGPINKQTLFSTLLFHDILTEPERQAAADSLLVALHSGPSGHLSTGIFGTKYILETLSLAGFANEIFRVVNSTEYPGWGHMVSQGATTLWETWKESDNTYSNCHPMFGSVSEWLYRWLGGIRPDPDYPGFSRFSINPALPEALSYVECTYNSPFGQIVSNWKRIDSTRVRFDITVPVGSIAAVKLHANERDEIAVKGISDAAVSPSPAYKDGSYNFELEAGKYILILSIFPWHMDYL
jgi:alpha-L-rhamnosidase